MKRLVVLLGLLAGPALAQLALAQPALGQDIAPSDPADYPDAPGREDAVAFCGACHSFRIVAQQGMSRAQWDETLTWMVQRHAMPQLDKEDLDPILDYLAKAFPQRPGGGRPGWTNPFAPRR